ncbi:protein STRUBBELIG-RECEPTOR FAMILY 8 isoform X2 [Selaginella moellendorffii]|uniref:protein STRUBBELIG-RECEPTOR FAMILY 8 isoform X2 n=1 Tax=Selaginella moellendorffii TaxID=88036 RepID=UPI000D1CB2B4|nr:protein STRUBBELIG-RECEPTOR FAMILY 8 isoform X2 [Selaginella moellendorffii]|eukprot:XP_024518068.1 protein STRUBBELIG-RECEPTOR FAMILY 8 isoform X2 [Selaginella moellendorffii]
MLQFFALGVILSLSPQASDGLTDPQDVYALRILYESLRSPSVLGWKPHGGGDPCGEHWHGVECSGDNVIAIRLSGLKLRGSLGYALNKFTSLSILDLSNNHIGETLPFEFPARVSHLNLGNNVFIGPIPYSMKRLMSLTSLNLSTNFLSGYVPDIFEKLSNLHTFDISNNNFTGELPDSFSLLSGLATLHIQQNQLNGTLQLLEHLPLKDLNIENNDFTGKLPVGLQSLPKFRGGGNRFDDFPYNPSSSHEGTNAALPMQGPRPHESLKPYQTSSSFLTGAKLAGIITGAIVVAFVLTFFVFTLSKLKRVIDHGSQTSTNTKLLPSLPSNDPPGKEKGDKEQTLSSIRPLPMEKYHPPIQKTSGNLVLSTKAKELDHHIAAASFSCVEIQAATRNFGKHNLIGEGLLGSVYRAEFPSGQVFAIKKLDSTSSYFKDEETLRRIISSISSLRHGNIVELCGFCVEKNQCFLVYPYFSTGTLHDHLHSSPEKNLSWNQRMKVSLGAARALEYLHEVASPVTVHRNFKSANILLDQEFNPFVSDTGLAALIPLSLERQISSQMLGSFGYSAPEYALAGIYTVKSDVYSFGVLMLELLTGREPLDSSRPRSKELSLVAWAVPKLNDLDSLASIVDPKLEGMYAAKALSRYAEIITQCIQAEAVDRPAMSEVVQSLAGLMQRAGTSKKTVSREMPLQQSPGRAPLRNSGNEVASTSSPSFEKSFEAQNLSDSIKFSM